jgi:hypothetical protein
MAIPSRPTPPRARLMPRCRAGNLLSAALSDARPMPQSEVRNRIRGSGARRSGRPHPLRSRKSPKSDWQAPMQSLEQTCCCVQQGKKRRNNRIDGEADWVPELKGQMPQSDILLRTTRGIQQTLFAPQGPSHLEVPGEPKGVVYTKRWVVELLLDLAGYRSEASSRNPPTT